MRLGKFESAGVEPIGEGQEKRVFVDPKNEGRVIAEIKEDYGKETPRQLKGRYYLTKIVHLLLPKNIPAIYQVSESVEGKQIVDTERIAHTPGHALLQEAMRSGKDKIPARHQMSEEMGEEMLGLDLELERIGLGFDVDSYEGNYTKDEAGNVYYLETFKPWESLKLGKQNEMIMSFNEGKLRQAIDDLSDSAVKEKCGRLLDRLLALAEEEKQEMEEEETRRVENLMESTPYIQEFEEMLAPFLKEDVLANFHSLATEEEARSSEERKSAIQVLAPTLEKLNFLEENTNINAAEYDKLYEKYEILARATGTINGGVVDHTR